MFLRNYIFNKSFFLTTRAGRDETESTTSQTHGRLSGQQLLLQSRGLFVELERDQEGKRSDQGNIEYD